MSIYDYQRPLGKINDIAELRQEFINIFDSKSKHDMALFGLAYARHLLELIDFEPSEEVAKAIEAIERWIDGKTNYHEARNISFRHLYNSANKETDIIKKRFYKTMAQIACIPHVKAHALWATDFAITLINELYPNSLEQVKKERLKQLALLKS